MLVKPAGCQMIGPSLRIADQTVVPNERFCACIDTRQVVRGQKVAFDRIRVIARLRVCRGCCDNEQQTKGLGNTRDEANTGHDPELPVDH